MKLGFLAVLLTVIAIVISNTAFLVNPGEQAVVMQFGKIEREIKESGLYFKTPFVQDVTYLDKRLIDLSTRATEAIASDQKRIVVDAFAQYKIIDAVLFLQTARTIPNGNVRLRTFFQSSLKQVIASAPFIAILRDNRVELMGRIKFQMDRKAREIGIEVVDVRIRRADLPDANSLAVFQRMQTERVREATEIRAKGAEAARRIRARADRDATVLIAEAQRESEELRGTGDAERNTVFAQAYGQDTEFFEFYRTMQAYERGLLGNNTNLVISPDSEFFNFFGSSTGRKATVQ